MKNIHRILFAAIALCAVMMLTACNPSASKPAETVTPTEEPTSSYSSSSHGSSNYTNSYDMPNEDDESFSDYVKRVDPDLYDSLDDRYDTVTSGSSSSTGAGGYEMPNESDESFSDYVKRVDPDLYRELEDIYGSLG